MGGMIVLKHVDKSALHFQARTQSMRGDRAATQKSSFQEQLKQQALQSMMGKVEDLRVQGNKLVEHRSYEALSLFRHSLEACLTHVLKDSYQLTRTTSSQFGQFKQHQLVQVVNQEMDELAKEIVDSQKTSIDLLKRVGKLEGLLLEIYI